VSGLTGQAIIRAILRGERDPQQLAKLRDYRVAASEAEIAHSLEGNWREDVLFELQQVVDAYDFHQKQIAACDVQLQKYLSALPIRSRPGAGEQSTADAPSEKPNKQRRHKLQKNQPTFNLAAELQRTMGVDVTAIDGVDVMTTQVILSELGPDLSTSFPSEGHFASWLELAPRRDVSGGKVLRHKSRKSNNRVATALRMAAQSLWRSDSYLGARYRHLKARLGGQKAVKAMARYLACLIYRLLTKGKAYVDRGAAHFQSKRTERELLALRRKAAELGMEVVAVS
jgi:transposase